MFKKILLLMIGVFLLYHFLLHTPHRYAKEAPPFKATWEVSVIGPAGLFEDHSEFVIVSDGRDRFRMVEYGTCGLTSKDTKKITVYDGKFMYTSETVHIPQVLGGGSRVETETLEIEPQEARREVLGRVLTAVGRRKGRGDKIMQRDTVVYENRKGTLLTMSGISRTWLDRETGLVLRIEVKIADPRRQVADMTIECIELEIYPFIDPRDFRRPF